jgi:hypothetical protein
LSNIFSKNKEELEVLVENVAVNKQLLLEKFSDTTTNERKKKVWKNISAKMSAVGDTKRCSDDVRKTYFRIMLSPYLMSLWF